MQSAPRAVESETGPGLGAEPIRMPERGLGDVEIDEPPADVADLGPGRGRVGEVDTGQLIAGASGLALGFGRVPAPVQGGRMMDPAQAREDGERVPFRPPGGRPDPLGGAAEVAQLLAGADQAAIPSPPRSTRPPALPR